MRNILTYLCLLVCLISKSQNLVPNSGFETYTVCPTNANKIYYAPPWFGPQYNSTDYFNNCSSVLSVNPPNCGGFYQNPRTGDGLVGMWLINNFGTNYREYMMCQLIAPPISNNCYYFSFYVNLANNFSKYSIKDIGLGLTTNSYTTSGPSSNNVINLPNAMYNFNRAFLTDTLNWMKVEGIYEANGTEQYIIIGNFKNDANTDTLNMHFGSLPSSYYFIDDVSIEQLNTPFWTYRDTTVTIGDSVLIGPSITGLNINWYDSNNNFIANAPAIYAKPNSPTFYTASENFCNGISTHTINVMVTPTSVKEYSAFTNSISLFPNPTTNNFTISYLTESSKLKVDITDTQGKLYSTELITIPNNKATIKTNLPNGVYFVSITDTVSGLKAVKKLIVQK